MLPSPNQPSPIHSGDSPRHQTRRQHRDRLQNLIAEPGQPEAVQQGLSEQQQQQDVQRMQLELQNRKQRHPEAVQPIASEPQQKEGVQEQQQRAVQNKKLALQNRGNIQLEKPENLVVAQRQPEPVPSVVAEHQQQQGVQNTKIELQLEKPPDFVSGQRQPEAILQGVTEQQQQQGAQKTMPEFQNRDNIQPEKQQDFVVKQRQPEQVPKVDSEPQQQQGVQNTTLELQLEKPQHAAVKQPEAVQAVVSKQQQQQEVQRRSLKNQKLSNVQLDDIVKAVRAQLWVGADAELRSQAQIDAQLRPKIGQVQATPNYDQRILGNGQQLTRQGFEEVQEGYNYLRNKLKPFKPNFSIANNFKAFKQKIVPDKPDPELEPAYRALKSQEEKEQKNTDTETVVAPPDDRGLKQAGPAGDQQQPVAPNDAGPVNPAPTDKTVAPKPEPQKPSPSPGTGTGDASAKPAPGPQGGGDKGASASTKKPGGGDATVSSKPASGGSKKPGGGEATASRKPGSGGTTSAKPGGASGASKGATGSTPKGASGASKGASGASGGTTKEAGGGGGQANQGANSDEKPKWNGICGAETRCETKGIMLFKGILYSGDALGLCLLKTSGCVDLPYGWSRMVESVYVPDRDACYVLYTEPKCQGHEMKITRQKVFDKKTENLGDWNLAREHESISLCNDYGIKPSGRLQNADSNDNLDRLIKAVVLKTLKCGTETRCETKGIMLFKGILYSGDALGLCLLKTSGCVDLPYGWSRMVESVYVPDRDACYVLYTESKCQGHAMKITRQKVFDKKTENLGDWNLAREHESISLCNEFQRTHS
ncbi:unnamed protein product, partial [Mesorhabditis spiculigera]